MTNAIFVGDGTLLIQCAELFAERGGEVVAVATSDPFIRDWAAKRGVAHAGSPAEIDLGGPGFDYLFSVANLTVLPEALIAQAGRMAINFHDGPLPRLAGLNATTWAILEGADSHQVTWHEMAGKVDAGRILATADMEIAENETAFSLNAKCYEAGLESFGRVLDGVFSGDIPLTEQSGERGWYGRAKRPDLMGVLDFSRPAAELDRLVRGLDFGAYANTVTTPKIWTGSDLVIVGAAELRDGAGAPGQILAAEADSITVAAADGALALTGLRDVDGGKLDLSAHGLRAGGALPPAPTDRAASLNAAVSEAAKADLRWLDALMRAQPVQTPLASTDDIGGGVIEAAVHGAPSLDQAIAGFAAWAVLLGAEPELSFVVSDGVGDAAPWIASDRLLTLAVDPTASGAALTSAAGAAFAKAAETGQRSCDLAARMADANRADGARQALSIGVVSAAAGESAAQVLGRKTCVLAIGEDGARLIARQGAYNDATLGQAAALLGRVLDGVVSDPDAPLSRIAFVGAGEGVETGPAADYPRNSRIHEAFAEQAARNPEKAALVADGATLTYADLDARAAALAGALAAKGAKAGVVVGLCLERSADLIISQMAILKTGAAYLPLDPTYPADRIAYMIEDSGAPLIVASRTAQSKLGLDPAKVVDPSETGAAADGVGGSGDLAYLIYTSGSTGKPKGVMVTHQNVLNFFAGMDAVVPMEEDARLLAVTSVSFDISVLEIFWTLARGVTVVLQTDGATGGDIPSFSLFYFASEAAGSGHHAYRLLMEGAKFADENGFEAIWTPERHFHAFGGLYPNPAVSSAAVAGMTKNVKVRGGSCVLPLHHPLRVAEDWALVDNISNGRAGIAIASGWQPNDFVLKPENFEDRKDKMLEGIDTLRKLWAGEAVKFPNHKGEEIEVSTLPKPVNGQIPLWVTAAGNPETFAAAAKNGCGVLTHLLGQTFDEVAEKIKAYRVAWREAGHPGTGTVTLMLHSFVGDSDDQVREAVREPMKGYLKSAVDLVRRASWSFPTFVQKAEGSGMTPQEVFEKEELSEEETDALLTHAFERYYKTSGLFGTPETCEEIVRNVAAIGVDEIACLIDFGVDTDLALANLPNIKTLMDRLASASGVGRRASVAEYIVENEVTHLQCTPSAASLLTADAPGRTAVSHLQAMMVGGEALPPELARTLRGNMTGELLNMYGPTETTIWSSVAALDQVGDAVPLGQAIANTTLTIRNVWGQVLPDGMAGELWIGGEGVTEGYWNRPDLTAERFVTDPDGSRHYRTGDLVRRSADGSLGFLGRMDNQVKIRGHRIELGEIEAALGRQTGVREAVVIAFEDGSGDKRLVGYATAEKGVSLDAADLRKSMGQALPEFMTPSQIVVMDSLPTTPNGKVDRKALPSPMARSEGPAVEAGNDTEAAIAEIWKEALGLPSVGVTDNFFDIGGHSLLVVQVQRRLKEKLDREVQITDMFRFSTIQSLAAHLSGDGEGDGMSAAKRGQARAQARRARLARQRGVLTR